MKKLISTILVFVLAFSLTTLPVKASEPYMTPSGLSIENIEDYDTYHPLARWACTQSIIHGVSFSSGKANMVCSYQLYDSQNKVSFTSTLQKLSGSSWQNITTMSASGTFYADASKSVAVSSGIYRLQTVGKVYSPSGGLLETVTVYSSLKSC